MPINAVRGNGSMARIEALVAQVEALTTTDARLVARIAELKARLDPPPKTPSLSSLPPSKGRKSSETSKPKSNPHRWLHPNPTLRHPVFACRRGGCGADVSQVPQSRCETYDRIEIPQIGPAGFRPSRFKIARRALN